MLFWRGWGILVFVATFGWLFILMGIVIAGGSHEPDAAKAAADTDRLFALSFLLSAATVFLLARYREKTPGKVVDPRTGQIHLIPHVDEFMFIRMKYWTFALLAISIWMFLRSFFE
ncbi:MAG: hypothetical protein ACE144_13515 [Thermodesulfobacteriota bacterium]